mgnify:CR=1 FL=1
MSTSSGRGLSTPPPWPPLLDRCISTRPHPHLCSSATVAVQLGDASDVFQYWALAVLVVFACRCTFSSRRATTTRHKRWAEGIRTTRCAFVQSGIKTDASAVWIFLSSVALLFSLKTEKRDAVHYENLGGSLCKRLTMRFVVCSSRNLVYYFFAEDEQPKRKNSALHTLLSPKNNYYEKNSSTGLVTIHSFRPCGHLSHPKKPPTGRFTSPCRAVQKDVIHDSFRKTNLKSNAVHFDTICRSLPI